MLWFLKLEHRNVFLIFIIYKHIHSHSAALELSLAGLLFAAAAVRLPKISSFVFFTPSLIRAATNLAGACLLHAVSC